MPADPIPTNPDDCFKLRLILTVSAQVNGECGRAVRTSRWSSTSLSLTRAIRDGINGRPRGRTWNIAPSISMLRVIAHGAGS
jgi:hypothetical protein